MFQYPLRVEMDWNQARHLSLDTEPHRFSTLCGSKWIGTCRRSDHLLPFQQVSVPSAGRNGLELNRFATSLCNLSGFQYPLRVEMDWNAAPNSHRDSHFRSFSTLCGSKWIGTSPDLSGPSASIVFQYPLRVEMDWNCPMQRAPCLI